MESNKGFQLVAEMIFFIFHSGKVTFFDVETSADFVIRYDCEYEYDFVPPPPPPLEVGSEMKMEMWKIGQVSNF